MRPITCDGYDVASICGEGSFGSVYYATRVATGEAVALKQLAYSHSAAGGISATLLRETAILRLLAGEAGCVELIEVVVDEPHPNGAERRALLVFPHYACDLAVLVAREDVRFSVEHVQFFALQLAGALAHAHAHRVVHRDVKSANVLIASDLTLKLADWGQATVSVGGAVAVDLPPGAGEPRRSGGACSMWFRAPELLFGARHYDAKVDIWSLGCIFAELLWAQQHFSGEKRGVRAIMRGRDVAEQIRIVVGVCGAPAAGSPLRSLPRCPQPDAHGTKRRCGAAASLAALLGVALDANDSAARFLERCIVLEPASRAHAAELLRDAFLADAPTLGSRRHAKLARFDDGGRQSIFSSTSR